VVEDGAGDIRSPAFVREKWMIEQIRRERRP
jgi:hypothetical protein